MEIKFYNIEDVKSRFALLLAKLHDAGFLIDYINEVMIKSPFFDCFEKNDLNDFMTMSFETITEKVFGKEVVYNYSHDLINPYYWAGLSIMDVMLNSQIPLKRILLIMPIKEIIGCFDVYHEMHPIQFINHYLELEDSRSLFRILRKEKELSVSKISALTDIKESLLNYFDYSNATFLATSFSNLSKLSMLFDVSIDIFKKKSSYVPCSIGVIKSKDFSSIIIKKILEYYGNNQKSIVVDKYITDKEARRLLNDYGVIVDMSNPFGVIYSSSNRLVRKYLSKEEFFLIYQKSINILKNNIVGLIF